ERVARRAVIGDESRRLRPLRAVTRKDEGGPPTGRRPHVIGRSSNHRGVAVNRHRVTEKVATSATCAAEPLSLDVTASEEVDRALIRKRADVGGWISYNTRAVAKRDYAAEVVAGRAFLRRELLPLGPGSSRARER